MFHNIDIVFELITNRIVERIELLVIVRLYGESENNIYLMRCLRVSICVRRFACVENFEKAFGDLDFVFGETVMPNKTNQSTQEYPNRTARRSLTKEHRAMAAVTERWCCTTGPGSQVIRWMRIQLHQEGVMLVNVGMMRAYLM